MADEDLAGRLAYLEVRLSEFEGLRDDLRRAEGAVESLVWVLNELIDDNDLTANDDVDEVLAQLAPMPWVDLPEGRQGPAPELPPGRDWPEATRAAWASYWSSPMATQWDPDGNSFLGWADCHADFVEGKGDRATLSAVLRQYEDDHGLNPLARARLRWRLPSDPPAPRHLRSVDDVENPDKP